MNKKAQEEMFGFALIIILVLVVGLVFLSLNLNKPQQVKESKDLQIDNFIGSMLHYTTDYTLNSKILDLNDLIQKCEAKEILDDSVDSCKALNETITEIMKVSWKVGEDRESKAYELVIAGDFGDIVSVSDGNKTSVIRGYLHNRYPSGSIRLRVYT